MSADAIARLADRTATLAALLDALADAAERGRLAEPVLRLAASFAIDTHNQVDTLLAEQRATSTDWSAS